MGQGLPDIVIGAICIIVFLPLAVVTGGILQRRTKSRNRRALVPLAPILHGSVESDHKSAWIDGEFDGRRVRVRLTPDQDISQSSEYSIRINLLEIHLFGLSGRYGWEIARTGLLRKTWEVKASDETIRGKLSASDLISRLQKIGNHPSLRYEPGSGTLELRADVKPRLAPQPDQLRTLLELMIHASEVHAIAEPAGP